MGRMSDETLAARGNDHSLTINVPGLEKIAEPLAEEGVKLLSAVCGKPAGEVGGIVTDQLRYWRWRNRLRVAAKAAKLLEESKVAAKITPPGFLLPLLEAAGDSDDEAVQDLWGKLLAAGIEKESARHPAFRKTIERMSGDDGRFLEKFINEWVPDKQKYTLAMYTAESPYPPEVASLAALGILASKIRELELDGFDKFTTTAMGDAKPLGIYDEIGFTPFGQLFIEAILPVQAKRIREQSPANPANARYVSQGNVG